MKSRMLIALGLKGESSLGLRRWPMQVFRSDSTLACRRRCTLRPHRSTHHRRRPPMLLMSRRLWLCRRFVIGWHGGQYWDGHHR